MLLKVILIALFCVSLVEMQSQEKGLSNEECVQNIYHECNGPKEFSEEELENVRQFLNYSFTVLADIKPDKPLCPKLHVRQDWKCLSQQQKTKVVNVFKKMYERGDVHRLADVHVKVWPAWHKTPEFFPSHRYFAIEFERLMQKIDPGVTLPHWDSYTYGAQPDRSSIWDTLGHSGNYSTGYSVTDGIYAELNLVPTLKRHWLPDGKLAPWFTQEFISSMIQSAENYREMTASSLGLHYPPLLNMGGYEGQYSVRSAPYEVLFYMHHTNNVDNVLFRWQLQRQENLTPKSYNLMPRFNPQTGKIGKANIEEDRLTGFPDVRIKELFWVGFGDACFIMDSMVKPINNLWKGITNEQAPTAVKRMPKSILDKWFPLFAKGNFSGLFHSMPEVGNCNTKCLPIPRPTLMRETQQGRRLFQAYTFDEGLDHSKVVEKGENRYIQMWEDLNKSGYCSPYVTSY